ncbi:MAG: UPF0280 family protein [Candidatus Omnitrophica bacterium]|nr:UPF0280 family protein [Candidatus Omnitrophota bacterium]
MKTGQYHRRLYRDWVKAGDLHHAHVIAPETDLQILTNKPLDKDVVIEHVRHYRWDIDHYIADNRRFLAALKPLAVDPQAPPIIQAMAQASSLANSGPMTAVAGTITQFLGNDLLKLGFKEVIVENGGDIFLKTRRIRRVGIYTGNTRRWTNLALEIRPKDTPLGLGTFSGTIGHSLGFSCADSVVIISKDVSLADALATATANLVHDKKDLPRALTFAQSVRGVVGVVIILKNNLVSAGSVTLVE